MKIAATYKSYAKISKLCYVLSISILFVSIIGAYYESKWVESLFALSCVILFFAFDHARLKTPWLFGIIYVLAVLADVFLIYDFRQFEDFIISLYALLYVGLFIFSWIEFKPYKPTLIDWISLLIIYAFISWLVFYMYLISVDIGKEWSLAYYSYTLMVCAFVFVSYTHYTGKSYKASLCLSLSGAFGIMQGVFYFMYEYSIHFYFVKVLYTIFHFLWFLSMLLFIKYRRPQKKLGVLGV